MSGSPTVLWIGRARPELAGDLATQGWGCSYVELNDLRSGMTGGDLILVPFADHGDPLGLLAQLWCSEPDLGVVTLSDHREGLVATALRAGVAANVEPPHRPRDVARALQVAWDKRRAGALRLDRDLARSMSVIATLTADAVDQGFVQGVLDEMCNFFGVRRASVMLFEAPEDPRAEMFLKAHRGLDHVGQLRVARGTGIAGRVAQEGIPQLLLRSASEYARFKDVDADSSISASLCVPIRGSGDRGVGRVLGVINLARLGRDDIFTPRDLEVCEFIASLVGQTLCRLELDYAQADMQRKIAATEKLAYAGEIAAGIAHEVASPIGYLRTNLNALTDYLDDLGVVLDQAGKEDPDLLEVIEDIPVLVRECLTGADRAAKIVNDMKAMVRMGEDERAHGAVDLADVVKSAVHLLRPRFADRCRVDMATEATPMLGLEVELGQMMVNLLVNALDACMARFEQEKRQDGDAAEPKVRVTAFTLGDTCVVEVADNGVGISQVDQQRIFAPLFTTKPSGVGTGLGLGIVRRIVDGHRGLLELESEVGVGTCFRVSFPQHRPDIAPMPSITSLAG